jgi:hypothetical protein
MKKLRNVMGYSKGKAGPKMIAIAQSVSIDEK